MKILFALFVCTYLHTVRCEIEVEHVPKPCQVILQCPEHGETAFASDGQICHVYENSCALRNENCRRHNVFFKTLMPITNEECLGMCPDNCSKCYECSKGGLRICVLDGDKMRTMNSFCEWEREMCKEKRYIQFMLSAPCPGLKDDDDKVGFIKKIP